MTPALALRGVDREPEVALLETVIAEEADERAGLLGRAAEWALLDDLCAGIRAGDGRTLLLHGAAGIGKSALLDYVVESVDDMRVLRAAGVESEMELPYASLHQLCTPLLGVVARLPAPQRDALEV